MVKLADLSVGMWAATRRQHLPGGHAYNLLLQLEPRSCICVHGLTTLCRQKHEQADHSISTVEEFAFKEEIKKLEE